MGNGVMCQDEDGDVVGCDRFGIPGFGQVKFLNTMSHVCLHHDMSALALRTRQTRRGPNSVMWFS